MRSEATAASEQGGVRERRLLPQVLPRSPASSLCPHRPPHRVPPHLTRRGEGPGAGAVALVQGLVDHPGPLCGGVEVARQHLIGVHGHLPRQSRGVLTTQGPPHAFPPPQQLPGHPPGRGPQPAALVKRDRDSGAPLSQRSRIPQLSPNLGSSAPAVPVATTAPRARSRTPARAAPGHGTGRLEPLTAASGRATDPNPGFPLRGGGDTHAAPTPAQLSLPGEASVTTPGFIPAQEAPLKLNLAGSQGHGAGRAPRAPLAPGRHPRDLCPLPTPNEGAAFGCSPGAGGGTPLTKALVQPALPTQQLRGRFSDGKAAWRSGGEKTTLGARGLSGGIC